jgi:hypothetical protein
MSQPEDSADRFSLVSSFYGPGTVGSWLCILASVFVTWTLNIKSRRCGSITNDFIAALSMPAVAAGHVFYLLFTAQRPVQLGEYSLPDQSDLFTNALPIVARYAASVEAPLNVCETFAAAALALIPIAGLARQTWRAVCVLVVGLLAFSTEAIIFAQTSGIAVSDSDLARPFLFNFYDLMPLMLAFLGVSLIGLLVLVSMAASSSGSVEEGPRSPSQELQTFTDEEILRGPTSR